MDCSFFIFLQSCILCCLILYSVFCIDGLFLVEQTKRVSLLMAAATFQGASVGPLIDLAININPRYTYLLLGF